MQKMSIFDRVVAVGLDRHTVFMFTIELSPWPIKIDTFCVGNKLIF